MPTEINFRKSDDWDRAYETVTQVNYQWRCTCFEFGASGRVTCRHIKTVVGEQMMLENVIIKVPPLRETIKAAQLAFYGVVLAYNTKNSSPFIGV